MGFAISWLAVSGKSPELVLGELRLSKTAATEEFPESPITCANLPSNWFLVFANTFNSPLVLEETLRTLSTGCEVLSCQVEEHVMFSSATYYVNSQKIWHVEHDAQESIYHLQSQGTIPPQFGDIFAAVKQQQDEDGGIQSEVDYIHDAPVALASSIVSFRHDQDIAGAGPEPFEVLTRETSVKPWWRFW